MFLPRMCLRSMRFRLDWTVPGEFVLATARFSNKINCKRILREIAILQRLDRTRSLQSARLERRMMPVCRTILT